MDANRAPANRFTPAAERQQDEAIRRHQDKVRQILKDPKKLRTAIVDYFADRDCPDEWGALANLAITAELDEAEAGRQIRAIAAAAAHECARWQLGDDMEAVEPAEPYKPTRPIVPPRRETMADILEDFRTGKVFGIPQENTK